MVIVMMSADEPGLQRLRLARDPADSAFGPEPIDEEASRRGALGRVEGMAVLEHAGFAHPRLDRPLL